MHWLILSFNPHFFKLQYVNKFWSSFSQILMEHVPTHNFPVKKRHNFSRVKYGRTFSKKIFSWQGNRLYGERVVLHGRNNDQNMPREWVTNAFSSNLNLLNLNIFPNHWGILTWRKNSDQSIELLKELTLRLVIIKRFQRSCHHQFYSCWPWPSNIIWKVNITNMGFVWKILSANYASGVEDFMQSLFSFFLICLVVTSTLMPWLQSSFIFA